MLRNYDVRNPQISLHCFLPPLTFCIIFTVIIIVLYLKSKWVWTLLSLQGDRFPKSCVELFTEIRRSLKLETSYKKKRGFICFVAEQRPVQNTVIETENVALKLYTNNKLSVGSGIIITNINSPPPPKKIIPTWEYMSAWISDER